MVVLVFSRGMPDITRWGMRTFLYPHGRPAPVLIISQSILMYNVDIPTILLRSNDGGNVNDV